MAALQVSFDFALLGKSSKDFWVLFNAMQTLNLITIAGSCDGGKSAAAGAPAAVTAAQRARADRNKQRAHALKNARLVQRLQAGETGEKSSAAEVASSVPTLSNGGFLVVEEAPPPRRAAPPAPLPHRTEQPHCLHCDHPFPHSYLFDTFDYSVCDACRDDEEAHSLVTRTEALTEFLLKECDLDARPPPLRCIRRRNPHRTRFAEMRLYLRVQVEARALEVWGSREALERERETRRERQARAKITAERKRLRALRMDVRSSLFDRTRAAHEHAFGPESHDVVADTYSRTCSECGHVDVYEKM